MRLNNFSLRDKRILLTGSAGFVGGYVLKSLLKEGVPSKNISTPSSKDLDLRKEYNCIKATKDIDILIHVAGNVGGIGKNLQLPATLLYDNLLMGVHLIESARKSKVQKVVLLGTICSYPKFTPTPFREKDLWNGYPEETNAPYGLAKKILLVQAQAYRKQYGLNCVYLLPVNTYGPKDNFDPESSHVIAALIHKISNAKKNGEKNITVWGDGTPTREFLYVEDFAQAIIRATKYYNKPEPVNIGSGQQISIKKLVSLIAKEMNFKGKIIWDTSKPNGQPKRLLDTSKAYQEFGFKAKTPFEIGIKRTIAWYKKNYQ